jgi:hypothetical protein
MSERNMKKLWYLGFLLLARHSYAFDARSLAELQLMNDDELVSEAQGVRQRFVHYGATAQDQQKNSEH